MEVSSGDEDVFSVYEVNSSVTGEEEEQQKEEIRKKLNFHFVISSLKRENEQLKSLLQAKEMKEKELQHIIKEKDDLIDLLYRNLYKEISQ